MSELNPLPQSDSTADLGSLSASIARVTEKVALISEAVKNLNQNRTQLEGKIDEAHKRVQRILSRLPEQGDGRQLNLLGEAIPPTTSEDDSEPTTH
jgi:predicted  nucleic acid-binding Zn-ribbon protein